MTGLHHNLLLHLAVALMSLSGAFGVERPQIYREDNGDLHINPGDNQTVYIGGVDILAENAELKAEIQALKVGGAKYHCGGGRFANAVTAGNVLSGCTTIFGTLWLEDSWTAAFGTFLENLTTITGDLKIEGVTSLTSVNGFPSLETVGGSLLITSNPSLTTATFPSLRGIGFHFQVRYNPSLEHISMPYLRQCTMPEISNNDKLKLCETLRLSMLRSAYSVPPPLFSFQTDMSC